MNRSKIVTLQLTGPISGRYLNRWSCSISGVTQNLLEGLRTIKLDLAIPRTYELFIGDQGGYIEMHTVSWEFEEKIDESGSKNIHDVVVPVDGVNDALNLIAYNGYRAVSNTSSVTTTSNGGVTRKSFVWTFQAN